MFEEYPPNVETLMRLADSLEAAAFRWGAITDSPASDQIAWEEARLHVQARRTALRRAVTALWATATGQDHLTPLVSLAAHLDCELNPTGVEDIDHCPRHGVYVTRGVLHLPT